MQYWTGKSDALDKQTDGLWVTFPQGAITAGRGGDAVQRLADEPVTARFLRIVMTASSNTCDTHGSDDPRNCVGYAIDEISAGNFNAHGEFIDLVKHAPGQTQTVTQASSVDPWHTADAIISSRIQTGFDLFFTSGYTNHLPAMIPIAMVYATPEDSAAELAYVEKRGYPISYVEMSEEPDGAYMQPEDYAAFYLQWATALHKVDPKLKLGGPVFTGVNEDIKVWPDAQGRTSWLGRFLDYLKAHGRMSDLAFVSFEHYPLDPCDINWSDLYREPQLVKGYARRVARRRRAGERAADQLRKQRLLVADRSHAGPVCRPVAGRQRGRLPHLCGPRRGLLSLAHPARAAALRLPCMEHLRQLCRQRQARDQRHIRRNISPASCSISTG